MAHSVTHDIERQTSSGDATNFQVAVEIRSGTALDGLTETARSIDRDSRMKVVALDVPGRSLSYKSLPYKGHEDASIHRLTFADA